jgi:hypothetical protein
MSGMSDATQKVANAMNGKDDTITTKDTKGFDIAQAVLNGL